MWPFAASTDYTALISNRRPNVFLGHVRESPNLGMCGTVKDICADMCEGICAQFPACAKASVRTCAEHMCAGQLEMRTTRNELSVEDSRNRLAGSGARMKQSHTKQKNTYYPVLMA